MDAPSGVLSLHKVEQPLWISGLSGTRRSPSPIIAHAGRPPGGAPPGCRWGYPFRESLDSRNRPGESRAGNIPGTVRDFGPQATGIPAARSEPLRGAPSQGARDDSNQITSVRVI